MLIASFRGVDFAIEIINLMGVNFRRIDGLYTVFLEIELLLVKRFRLIRIKTISLIGCNSVNFFEANLL
jgi:hypothetical protein